MILNCWICKWRWWGLWHLELIEYVYILYHTKQFWSMLFHEFVHRFWKDTMICPLRFILARCKQSPIEDVAIKICIGECLGIAEATDIWWTQTDRLWLWWSLVYNTSSMLCCVRPSANLRLAQPLPVGQQDPSKTKGRTATRLNCVLPGLPPISPNQNQQNL